ncbi:MAG: ParA family partition ATPase [Caulobacteraceae bacterium]
MKVISVVNQKGGVGKSTIACNLAVNAVFDGKRALLIDADPQGSSLSFRAIRQSDDIKAVSITQPTIHKDINDFSNFDVVIVDAGGRDNTLFRSAVTAASKGILLIPVLPSQYDIWAAEDTFKVLKEARIYVDIQAYAVFNQTIQNTTVSKEAREALEELAAESDIKLINTVLYSRVDYKKSISQGMGVIEYQPKGKAADEISSLYSEIKGILGL